MEQLDIFNFTEDEIENKKEVSKQDSITTVPIERTIVVAYEIDDLVKLVFPTEEQDFELHNYLEHYYPHLKNKKGRIIEIKPYKKLQYLIEFDIKHEDKQLIMYHNNLEWVGKL